MDDIFDLVNNFVFRAKRWLRRSGWTANRSCDDHDIFAPDSRSCWTRTTNGARQGDVIKISKLEVDWLGRQDTGRAFIYLYLMDNYLDSTQFTKDFEPTSLKLSRAFLGNFGTMRRIGLGIRRLALIGTLFEYRHSNVGQHLPRKYRIELTVNFVGRSGQSGFRRGMDNTALRSSDDMAADSRPQYIYSVSVRFP